MIGRVTVGLACGGSWFERSLARRSCSRIEPLVATRLPPRSPRRGTSSFCTTRELPQKTSAVMPVMSLTTPGAYDSFERLYDASPGVGGFRARVLLRQEGLK